MLNRSSNERGPEVASETTIVQRNLELWVRGQPNGIRAADAVDWAKEILSRYEGLVASRNAQTDA
jgi:hypothetical protein